MFDGKAHGAKQQSEGNLQLNLNAKSRNQSGYNGFDRNSDSMKENMGEKFSITSIPKSTTNKTYSSLT